MIRSSWEEIRLGYWHVSPAFTRDLPLLLNYLYRSEQAVCPALPAPQVMLPTSVDNDDILILVVDDHLINRRLLADQLGSLGYQVITASDVLDALNLISRQAVDIIFNNVNMPNKTIEWSSAMMTLRLFIVNATLHAAAF